MQHEEVIKCIGCGVTIQTENKTGLGYAPVSSLEKEDVICQRCFRLKNYNEIQDVSLTDDDFLRILHSIGEEKALIVKVVDIFDFNGSFLTGLHRFAGNNKVLLVGNKVDLLPKSVKHQKVIHWMKKAAKDFGLRSVDVKLISASKGIGIDEVAEAIEEYREDGNVYVVGCTNVGKSTFINRLLTQFSDMEESVITTSPFPGTTLDSIYIPLDEEHYIIDTPGIINHHQMAHFVDKKGLKAITPTKEMKPMVFQLQSQQTLYIGGLARFDYVKGSQAEKGSFTCYFANGLKIHRTKLEKANELFEKHKGTLLTPIVTNEEGEAAELVAHDFTIKEAKTDIVFSGLGWITMNHSYGVVRAYAPKGVAVTIRKSLI